MNLKNNNKRYSNANYDFDFKNFENNFEDEKSREIDFPE